MINSFLNSSYTKCGEEASPRPIYKIFKLSISLDQRSKILYSLPLLPVQIVVYHNTLR